MTHTDLLAPPPHDPAPGWGQSLSTGAAGITLLYIEYARAGFGGWDTVQKWAAAMTRRPIAAHPDACGLYRGAPAIAFALCAAEQPAFAAALITLESHITTLTRHQLQRAHERIDCGQLPRLREFDLVSGLTGIGAYLLHQHGAGELLRTVLAYLPHLRARLEQHLHHHGPPAQDGLLEGTAGINLTRHTTSANAPSVSRWDSCMLIDG